MNSLIYYERGTGDYWFPINGRYFPLKKSVITLALRAQGLKTDGPPWGDKNGLTQVEVQFLGAMNHRMVD